MQRPQFGFTALNNNLYVFGGLQSGEHTVHVGFSTKLLSLDSCFGIRCLPCLEKTKLPDRFEQGFSRTTSTPTT